MPVRFQSEEYFQEVNQALQSNEVVAQAAKGQTVAIQIVTTGAPQGEIRTYLKITDGVPSSGLGDVEKPDATITQNYETAAALDRNDLNPQTAFMQGKIKIKGNLMKMMQLQGFLQSLPQATNHIEREY